MRVFRNPAAAEAEGFKVSTRVYPWSAYKGDALQPTERARVLTTLEEAATDVLEAVKWAGGMPSGYQTCPYCRAAMPIHEPTCKLRHVLKAAAAGEPLPSPEQVRIDAFDQRKVDTQAKRKYRRRHG